ncbi:MAG: hypothetical protein MI717_08780, partial [Spirochaetales bacterium]|nr:hypothetical protein [Spirochaetales bacterium]
AVKDLSNLRNSKDNIELISGQENIMVAQSKPRQGNGSRAAAAEGQDILFESRYGCINTSTALQQ